MNEPDDDADPFFTPSFGVSPDLESGTVGVESLSARESINFPIDSLDEVIDQVISFAAAHEAGKDFVDPPHLAIGISVDYETGMVRLHELGASNTLDFPADRISELIDDLLVFRLAYKSGNCR